MPTRRHSATDELQAPEHSTQLAGSDTPPERGMPRGQPSGPRAFDGGGYGSGRKRRRRNRSQKGREHRPPQRGAPHVDIVSRERMFQDIEGLLRQIRERAEESPLWTEEQMNDFTQSVTGFTKSLEQESEQISLRARSEYQRIRDKLSQALRN